MAPEVTVAHDPLVVVQAFNAAWNAHDLERVIALFAAGAVVKQVPLPPPLNPGVYIGKPQIRGWLQSQLQQFHVVARNHRVIGNTVMWDETVSGDTFRHMGIAVFEVTAIATVLHGKITSLTMTPTPESHRTFRAAMQHADTSPSDAMR